MRIESISHSAHGADEAWAQAGLTEFVTQFAHMDCEIVLIAEPPITPDGTHHLVIGHDTTRLGGQH